MNLTDFADFLQQIASGNHGMTRDQIADKLGAFGRQLLQAEQRVRDGLPWQSTGGSADRCRVQVVGPDGEIKADKFHGNW